MLFRRLGLAYNLLIHLLVFASISVIRGVMVGFGHSSFWRSELLGLDGISEVIDLPGRTSSYQEGDIASQVFEKLAKPDSVFVDAGTGFGFYSIRASRRGSSVIGFEPDPAAFLVASLLCVGLDVRIHNIALSSTVGTIHFESRMASEGRSSSMLKLLSRTRGGFVVSKHPLDAFTRDIREISMLKLDVEGNEDTVIEGAGSTLAKTDEVLLESHFFGITDGIRTLMAMGFQCRKLRDAVVGPYLYGEFWGCKRIGDSKPR